MHCIKHRTKKEKEKKK